MTRMSLVNLPMMKTIDIEAAIDLGSPPVDTIHVKVEGSSPFYSVII